MWKSTVEPPPEVEDEQEANLTRPRNRVGQFFANAFRPLSRARVSSLGSVDSSDRSEISSMGDNPSTLQTSETGSPVSGSSGPHSAQRSSSLPAESWSAAVEQPKPRVPRANSHDREIGTRGTGLSPAKVQQLNAAAEDVPLPLLQTNPSSRWRLFQFRSRDGPPPNNTSEPDHVRPTPRKGDVVCLSYDTLDDKGMRRLEGRSDHRPVIGSYAVYL
jgi:hypothetical protein